MGKAEACTGHSQLQRNITVGNLQLHRERDGAKFCPIQGLFCLMDQGELWLLTSGLSRAREGQELLGKH